MDLIIHIEHLSWRITYFLFPGEFLSQIGSQRVLMYKTYCIGNGKPCVNVPFPGGGIVVVGAEAMWNKMSKGNGLCP